MDRRFYRGNAPEILDPGAASAHARNPTPSVEFKVGQKVEIVLDANCNARWHRHWQHHKEGVIVGQVKNQPGDHEWVVRLPMADPENPHLLTSLRTAEMREVWERHD